MLNRFVTGAEQIFLACGATDFRKRADSLAAIVSMQFHLDPFADQCVFLFCNRKRNGIKILRYDSNGFILASKKLLDGMKFQWPKAPEEVKEIEEYIIPETDTCSKCGSELKIIGKRIIRTEVEFIPAKLKVKQIVQQVAQCTKCGTDESGYDSCRFQKASVPVPPLAHSISTPSLIAQVMYQKFVMGMPFARQEKDWYRLGLVLSRADMANQPFIKPLFTSCLPHFLYG